ncbi:MAG: hypothetical protein IPM29_28835 [Planctomycetes bacterium]|nr:hypothetical protein [Planctomycetota bacterium]
MRPIAWTADDEVAATVFARAAIAHPRSDRAAADGATQPQIGCAAVVRRGRWLLGLRPGAPLPPLDEVARRLERHSWFRLRPCVHDIAPDELLAEAGRFRVLVPAAPDHPETRRALLGRLPLLTDRAGASLANALGRASWSATADDREHLRRLAFWTLEAGLVRERGSLRALGATVAVEPWLALPPLGDVRRFDPDTVVATAPRLRPADAPRFDLGSLEAAAAITRASLRARGLLG